MNTRINVEQEVQIARKHMQLPYIIVLVIGLLLPICLWLFSFSKIEAEGMRDFVKYTMIVLAIVITIALCLKLFAIQKKVRVYRFALTKYANLAEGILVPETAFLTRCLIPDVGRFAFDTIQYNFWKEGSELIFFPVRPNYFTAKPYKLVSSVRLDMQMVRSFYLIGEEFFETKGVPAPLKKSDVQSIDPLTGQPKAFVPVIPASTYQDTRATIIAYAVGDQTVYLTFDVGLYDQLKTILPGKSKDELDAQAKQSLADSLLPITGLPKENEAAPQLALLEEQLRSGAINQSEFDAQKQQLIDKG
ncbi:MAG: hypothetical protein A2Y16_04960 [Tenericutes bacterium GWF2_57_13]|nr:MAG: hypothetical protein A2Y16_04960 [Tenericutes bacterium GWF2_57_13]